MASTLSYRAATLNRAATVNRPQPSTGRNPQAAATLKRGRARPMDTQHQPRKAQEGPMPRIALFAVAGVILVGCAVAALGGAGHDQPGQIAALLLSLVAAGGGIALRQRPEA
jgi:hypothetical protein